MKIVTVQLAMKMSVLAGTLNKGEINMKLIINLKHDVVKYNKETKSGLLKENVFGCESFLISEFSDGFSVEFEDEGGGLLWTYPCYFTDHGGLLHVIIGEEK